MRYMILIESLLLLSATGAAHIPSKGEVRALYQKAVTDEDAVEKLIQMLKPYHSKSSPL